VIGCCPDPADAAWTRQGIDALLQLNDTAERARIAGRPINARRRAGLAARYTSAAAEGIRLNHRRRTKIEARHNALARRMLDRAGDYLRFAHDPKVPFTNGMAEALNGSFKAELIHRLGPWKTRAEAEIATYEWISWYNHARLHSSIGDVPPAEYEAQYYASLNAQAPTGT